MKKLATLLLALLPFMATSVMANPPHKNTSTKQTAQQGKKSQTKKSVEKNTKKNHAENTKTAQKKSASKAKKNKVKNQPATNKKSTASQKQTTAQKAITKSEKNQKSQQHTVEKKAKNEVLKATPVSQAQKAVVVPKCQDKKVTEVLSDAFNRQGKAMKIPMRVKNLSQIQETQHYPQQGIRSCYALVETNGKKYQTNYSVILNDNGFFVQVENAQTTF